MARIGRLDVSIIKMRIHVLGKNFRRRHFKYFSNYFYPEDRFLHVKTGFLGKCNEMSSAEVANKVVNV